MFHARVWKSSNGNTTVYICYFDLWLIEQVVIEIIQVVKWSWAANYVCIDIGVKIGFSITKINTFLWAINFGRLLYLRLFKVERGVSTISHLVYFIILRTVLLSTIQANCWALLLVLSILFGTAKNCWVVLEGVVCITGYTGSLCYVHMRVILVLIECFLWP